jgi:hypothetical protein
VGHRPHRRARLHQRRHHPRQGRLARPAQVKFLPGTGRGTA